MKFGPKPSKLLIASWRRKTFVSVFYDARKFPPGAGDLRTGLAAPTDVPMPAATHVDPAPAQVMNDFGRMLDTIMENAQAAAIVCVPQTQAPPVATPEAAPPRVEPPPIAKAAPTQAPPIATPSAAPAASSSAANSLAGLDGGTLLVDAPAVPVLAAIARDAPAENRSQGGGGARSRSRPPLVSHASS